MFVIGIKTKGSDCDKIIILFISNLRPGKFATVFGLMEKLDVIFLFYRILASIKDQK